ncbi:SIR2 family NAD-dependent protein deacylase [Flavobacterium silvaticum]|uniref:NAD-dependent protein deacylase n=1 Tax=Flavobacterium silvaticum TaxID=1852020 RepID=A0A972FQS8_9FLAO|nr:NAD-dependent deacylase [Flavobacterium silvaticum]NMH26768.1 NAD-dependent deacylase [Flavobacterium silvaticum]
MKKLLVLSGAGISAESGIKTFRDADGLWEGHDVMEVATPEGFQKNPALVLEFYNQRRKQLKDVKPNAAHIGLAELEKDFDISVVTQNVDDLHERGGSSKIVHLHGQLLQARSSHNPEAIIDWTADIALGQKATDGSQLRPHIVWFGEAVPAMEEAIRLADDADILVVIGTSLQVYPAAGLISYVRPEVPVFYIDPKPAEIPWMPNAVEVISMTASEGIAVLRKRLTAL